MPYIRKFCQAMRIPVLAVPGQEADDIIATVSMRALEAGLYPVIVTLDKDLYQLVDTILILNTSKDDLIVDREKVHELFGVSPEQIPDLLALWGDTSDNIPGAPGIGEKTARDLIQKFGSIEALLDRAEEIQSAKQRASLMENRQQILLSKQLVTVDTSLPIEIDWDEFKVQPPDRAALMPLLKELEFTGLIKEYLPAGIRSCCRRHANPRRRRRSPDTLFSTFAAIAFRSGRERVRFRACRWTNACRRFCSNPGIRKITYDLKDAMLKLRRRGLDRETALRRSDLDGLSAFPKPRAAMNCPMSFLMCLARPYRPRKSARPGLIGC